MAIEHLPRPWVLAAMTGLPVTELVLPPADERSVGPQERPLPRPEARRRRHELPHQPAAATVVGDGLN